jgi:hypothetical protein
MATKESISQARAEKRERAEHGFKEFLFDILEKSYDAEAFLRGIQALVKVLDEDLETDVWEPNHLVRLSISLQKVADVMGDIALEAEKYFYAHLKIRTKPVVRTIEGRA